MKKWKCPECGSHDLRVVAQVLMRLIQHDDNDEFEVVPDEKDPEGPDWNGDSAMICHGCERTDQAYMFLVE